MYTLICTKETKQSKELFNIFVVLGLKGILPRPDSPIENYILICYSP